MQVAVQVQGAIAIWMRGQCRVCLQGLHVAVGQCARSLCACRVWRRGTHLHERAQALGRLRDCNLLNEHRRVCMHKEGPHRGVPEDMGTSCHAMRSHLIAPAGLILCGLAPAQWTDRPETPGPQKLDLGNPDPTVVPCITTWGFCVLHLPDILPALAVVVAARCRQGTAD